MDSKKEEREMRLGDINLPDVALGGQLFARFAYNTETENTDPSNTHFMKKGSAHIVKKVDGGYILLTAKTNLVQDEDANEE